MDELDFDIIWILIAIVGGFFLAYATSIYLNIKDSPFYILHEQISSFLEVLFGGQGAIVFTPFIYIVIIISLIAISFLLMFRKYLH